MTTNHEHLREVAEKATPGPWNFSNAAGEWVIRDANQKYLGGLMKGTRQLSNTAVFIATFNPATAIALLDELAALRKENEALRDALKGLLADTQHSEHHCGDSECPVDAARTAIGDSHE